jgi:hypothetical protein
LSVFFLLPHRFSRSPSLLSHMRFELKGFWWESLKERGQQEDTDVDGRKLLKWISEK